MTIASPGLPSTATCGFAHGEPRGHPLRGSMRGEIGQIKFLHTSGIIECADDSRPEKGLRVRQSVGGPHWIG
jgi:hypothetical protein